MLELDFAVEKAEPLAHAASAELALTLAVRSREPARIHSVLLACQLRIDVVRRSYDAAEAERLFELFGERADWGRTQMSLLWSQTTVLVPAFEQATTVALPLACSLDFELGTAKYLHGLGQGVIPLLLLFSGTVFYAADDDRLQATPISRLAECRYSLPFELYRQTVARHFADRVPTTLGGDVLDRLLRYKQKSGAPTIDQALAELLDQAEVRGVSFEDALPVADAVLYEGYALYPYRASSPKNRVRFPFGGVYPPAYANAQTGADRSTVGTECLVEVGPKARLEIRLRCLTLTPRPAGGPDHWEEAQEKRLDFELALAPGEARLPFELGQVPGLLRVTTESVGPNVVKLSVAVENRSELPALERESALAESFLSLNLVLRAEGASFVSRLEPPMELSALDAGCQNDALYPVLVGRKGDRSSLLASPIILYDYPEVAASSPGDLFDSTEIDEILSLRIQTLTDAEKDEMRRMEPRLRDLLERTEALGPGELERLHGELRRSGGKASPFLPGARVRLRPKRRADIFDLALAGRAATVRSVECDAEGTTYLCVTVDDDPGADLGVSGQPGHRFFFTAEELEPLATEGE